MPKLPNPLMSTEPTPTEALGAIAAENRLPKFLILLLGLSLVLAPLTLGFSAVHIYAGSFTTALIAFGLTVPYHLAIMITVAYQAQPVNPDTDPKILPFTVIGIVFNFFLTLAWLVAFGFGILGCIVSGARTFTVLIAILGGSEFIVTGLTAVHCTRLALRLDRPSQAKPVTDEELGDAKSVSRGQNNRSQKSQSLILKVGISILMATLTLVFAVDIPKLVAFSLAAPYHVALFVMCSPPVAHTHFRPSRRHMEHRVLIRHTPAVFRTYRQYYGVRDDSRDSFVHCHPRGRYSMPCGLHCHNICQ